VGRLPAVLKRYRHWATLALAGFDLAPTEVRFLGHNSGVAYRVTTAAQGPFLLKIHVPRGTSQAPDPAHVEGVLAWLRELSGMSPGFPVQTPVTDLHGRLLPRVGLDGLSLDAPCSVQTWVDGEVLEGDLSVDQAAAVGRMTARLHTCASRRRAGSHLTGSELDATWFAVRQRALMDHLGTELISTADRSAIEAAGEIVGSTLQRIGRDRGVFGPIHGDLHQENIVWADQQPRPIDFAYLLYGPYQWDLGVLAYHTMYLPVAVRRSLVDAYVAARTDAPVQDLSLEVFLVAAAIENLAFQVCIPEQRRSALLGRNLTDLARGYCTRLIAGHAFVLA
jgi:Ser/Thr protein kinase RdoA (MazF antagonist)